MRIDVDYEHHPAFAPFIVEAPAGPSFAAAIVEMDEAINSQVFGRDVQKEGITSVIERLRRGIDDDFVIESGLKPFILDAVSRAVDRTVNEQKRRAAWPINVRKARRKARIPPNSFSITAASSITCRAPYWSRYDKPLHPTSISCAR